MDVVDSVLEVRRRAEALSTSIDEMYNEWRQFFYGNEHMIPNSVNRLVCAPTEFMRYIDLVEFDAQGILVPEVESDDDNDGDSDLFSLFDNGDSDVEVVQGSGLQQQVDMVESTIIDDEGDSMRNVESLEKPMFDSTMGNDPQERPTYSRDAISDNLRLGRQGDNGPHPGPSHGRQGDNGPQPGPSHGSGDNESHQDMEEGEEWQLSEKTCCPICLDECNGSEPVGCLHPCKHLIHTQCVRNLRACPQCRTQLQNNQYAELSSESAHSLSKMSYRQATDIIRYADIQNDSPHKVIKSVKENNPSARRALFTIIHDSVKPENIENIERLRTCYMNLNRLVFDNTFEVSPQVQCVGQYVTIKGNRVDFKCSMSKTHQLQYITLCVQMMHEYRKGYNHKDVRGVVNFVIDSFKKKVDVDVAVTEYAKLQRKHIAKFYRMANKEVYGGQLPNRVQVHLEESRVRNRHVYKLWKSPASQMVMFIVPTLNIEELRTKKMLREMRKLLSDTLSIDDLNAVRKRELDFMALYPHIEGRGSVQL